MRSGFTRGRKPLVAWVVVLLAAIAAASWQMTSGEWLRSNVFELLPKSDYDPLVEAATRVVDAELGTRLLFFVGHAERDAAKAAANQLATTLSGQALVRSVDLTVGDSALSSLAGFLYAYRTRLLSEDQVERIATDPEGIEADALAQFFSPFGIAAQLDTDPFSLFASSMSELQPAGSRLSVDDGYLYARRDDRDYVFVLATLASASLTIAEQEALARDIDTTLVQLEAADAGLDTLKTGFPFYAHEATRSAKGEVSTIGVGSLIGLLLLVIATFRSLRPLSLIVVSILAGCVIAMAVTLTLFGFVHLFTLVFGASLIGVSVDYSFHYIADDAFGEDDWTPLTGIHNIFPGITLGLITSILAYLALTVAPFPGLQQLAVFSTAGLIGAYLTLLCMCRLWRRRFAVQRGSAVLRFASRYLELWRKFDRRGQLVLCVVLAAGVAVLWRSIDVDDDVRVLQSQPPELVAQEAAIQSLLGTAQAGTFLLVTAGDAESLLRREEELRTTLDEMIRTGVLGSYQATSRWVPSAMRQERSNGAWQDLMRSRLSSLLATIGVSGNASRDITASASAVSPQLTVEDWLQHPASEPFRSLWISDLEDGNASLILLFGVDDLDALTAAFDDEPGATVMNKGRELSGLFGDYRARVAQLLMLAYAVILVGLSFRYALPRAGLLVVPPVLAGLVALVVISAFGESLNLFSFLALILVLGIGIDFTLFIAESRHELVATMFAITLSALTTMLSFGLLSLSSTYAVHSFGLTVLLGIACAYLLSPLAIGARAGSNAE